MTNIKTSWLRIALALVATLAAGCGDGGGDDGDAGTDGGTDTDTDADTDTDTDADSDADLDGGCDDAGAATEIDLPYEFSMFVSDSEPVVDFLFTVDAPAWVDMRGEEPPDTGLVTPPPMLLLDPDCVPYVDLGQDPYDQPCDESAEAEHGGPVYLDRSGSWRLRVAVETYHVYGTIGAAFSDPAEGFATAEPDSEEEPNAPFAGMIDSGAFTLAKMEMGVVLEEGDTDWIAAPLWDTRWPIAVLNEGAVPGHTAPTRVTAIDPYGDETVLTEDLFALPYLFYWSTFQGEHVFRFENAEPPADGMSWFVGTIKVYGEEFDPAYGGAPEVEPNDTMATAQPLAAVGEAPELSYSVAGDLETGGGDDWFLFSVPDGATYTTVYIFDAFYGYYLDAAVIYDEALTPISSTDDVFCTGYAFIDLPAGDYLVQAEGSPSGSHYKLFVDTSETSPWQWE